MYLVFNRESNDNQYLNNLLSVIILSSCFHFIRNFLISSGWIMEAPWVYGSFSMIYLLAPPVTFLYMRGILHDEDYFKKKDLVHFIAPFVQFLLSLKYIFSSNVHKLTIVRSISDSNNLLNSASFNGISYKIFFVAVFLSVLTYSIFCFRELKTREHFSASKHNRYVFRWTFTVTSIIVSMAFFMLMNAVETIGLFWPILRIPSSAVYCDINHDRLFRWTAIGIAQLCEKYSHYSTRYGCIRRWRRESGSIRFRGFD